MTQPYNRLNDGGTNGLSWKVHTAKEQDDGTLENFREWENVVDILNLPDGTVQFKYENEETHLWDAKIVRATVQGVEDAVRYRCSNCLDDGSDVIAAEPRGETMEMDCPLCNERTEFHRRAVDDL